jgi:6-phosphogluconolactonase/glucosamine-6-phosphate isomerase/deaminase
VKLNLKQNYQIMVSLLWLFWVWVTMAILHHCFLAQKRYHLDWQWIPEEAVSPVTPTEAPHERISMTLPRLLNTERLIVHISGQNKQKVLDQANAGNNVEELPIRAILQQTQVPATVFWAI